MLFEHLERDRTALVSKMQINFRWNVPTDLSYEAQALTTLTGAGLLSRRTAIDILSVIKDAETENARLTAEAEEDAKRQTGAWAGDPYTEEE